LKVAVADDTLQDFTTMSALLAGGNTEATGSGYSRKTLQNGGVNGVSVQPDNVNNQVKIDFDDLTYTSVAAGSTWVCIVFYYDPDSTDTMANCIPLWKSDFPVTTDGTTIVAVVPTGGYAILQ
jgi:hypothetical protein